MKLLLDECLPQDFRLAISSHEVQTVGYAGFKGLKNGELLRQAASAGFDVLITSDRHIPHQHDTKQIPLSVICLRSVSNDLEDLLPFVPELSRVLEHLPPRTIMEIFPS